MGALSVIRELQNNGYEAYYVGGCVRDYFSNKIPKDYDIVTSATTDQIEAIFPKTIAVGKSFGVIIVVLGDELFEVATFRKDSPGRKPTVSPGSLEEDARRRDFTINAIYHDPVSGRTTDPVYGMRDLENGILRTVGDPNERFHEDPLRLLRAIRFSADFKPTDELTQAVVNNGYLISSVSLERIKMEMDKILIGSNPLEALVRMHQSGMMARILPEVDVLFHTPQDPKWHPEGNAGIHTLMAVQEASRLNAPLNVRWACLFHDIGKAICSKTTPEGRITAHGHDKEGGLLAVGIMLRLKFSNKDLNHIQYLVENHMKIGQAKSFKKKTLMKMFYHGTEEGYPTFDDLVMLLECDTAASIGEGDLSFLKNLHTTLPPIRPVPLVTGADLIFKGLKPGPDFKRILAEAYDRQLENPSLTKEDLLNKETTHVED